MNQGNKKIQSFIMETCFRFASALRSISLKCFLKMTDCSSKGVGFCPQCQIVFFFSSNTVFFNVSFTALDSCFKGFLFFHFSILFKLQLPFSPVKVLHFFFSPMFKCANQQLFNISLVNGISEMGFEKLET